MSKFASFEKLESRQLLSAVPIGSKIKVAMVTDVDGNPVNASRLTVKFSENITLADTSKIRIFGYGVNPASASGTAQQKITINVSSVEAGPDGNKVIITTDRRVRKNAKITFYNGFAKNTVDNSDTGDVSTNLPKGLNKERYTLACRTFEPTDLKYFNNSIFASAPNVKATPTQPSSRSVRAALVSFLGKKVTAGVIDATKRDAALAKFDDATNIAIVPSANMRAAIVSLVGTCAEPAIASLLEGQNATGKKYTVIDFSDTEISSNATVSETILNETTGRLRTLYKSSYQGESFINLSANIAHEALHQDGNQIDGQNEEIFANVVETFVYAEQLAIDPAPAKAGTQMATNQNILLLAMLNSGTALFRVGLYSAPLIGGQNIFSGGTTPASGGDYKDFEDFVRRTYAARSFLDNETPANDVALQVQNTTCARTDTNTFNFRKSRLDFFDKAQQIVTDKLAIKLAAALKLQVQL